MSAFPLFRLSFVAAKAVVNRMDLGDLTALFLCSKKTQKFIKSLGKTVSFAALSFERKNNLNFLEIIELFRESKRVGNFIKEYAMAADIKISDDIGFELVVQFKIGEDEYEDLYFRVYAECKDHQEQYTGTSRNLKISDMEVPVVMTKKNEMHMFWDNKQEGFKKMGYFLEGNFVSRFTYLFINGGTSNKLSENLKFVINWINSTYQRLKYCIVEDNNQIINDEDVKFIIDTVHASDTYEFRVKLSNIFQHTTHFKSNRLELNPANWFTLENLLKTECQKEIHLEKSNLTNNDLNTYLKEWMAGKFPKLEGLYVEMQEDMNIDIILSGLVGRVLFRNNNVVTVGPNVSGFWPNILTRGSTPKTFEMKKYH